MAGRVARREIAALAAVALAVVLVSYWRVINAETFMRLAIGRFTAGEGLFADRDPWIYAVPALRWRNPEWLGDLLLYGAFRAGGGEPGLIAWKLSILITGWLLLYWLGRRSGGGRLVLVGLILLALAGSAGRFIERNDLHAYWLVPATGLVVQASARDRRWLAALPLLGWLWSGLHGSFVIGWLILGAALAQALVGPDRDRRRARDLALVLALHPLLPLLSPDGLHAYDLHLDVLRHRDDIRAIIKEWVLPGALPATLAGLPLHLMGILALVSFLPRPNRTQVAGVVLVAAGLVMAHGSLRFFLLFAMLAIPTVAANLHRAGAALDERRARWKLAGVGALLLGATALVVPAAIDARAPGRALENPRYPVSVARWLGTEAPAGSRLFNPYTGSQLLMWEAPAVGLYIHPHFSFDSAHLVRYVREVLARPEAFDAEVSRLGITLALVGRFDESGHLAAHLDRSRAWKLVYGDGTFAVYARRIPANRPLGATE